MSREDELHDVLNETVKEISRFSSNPRTWLDVMKYFLSCLEQEATDENPSHKLYFIDMLEALQDIIRNRLKTGGW